MSWDSGSLGIGQLGFEALGIREHEYVSGEEALVMS